MTSPGWPPVQMLVTQSEGDCVTSPERVWEPSNLSTSSFLFYMLLICLQVDVSCMEDVESLGNHGCTVKAFDELLTTYSSKALEFQVVQMERSQTKGESSR